MQSEFGWPVLVEGSSSPEGGGCSTCCTAMPSMYVGQVEAEGAGLQYL